jgi:trimeric autotransporter adhesin
MKYKKIIYTVVRIIFIQIFLFFPGCSGSNHSGGGNSDVPVPGWIQDAYLKASNARYYNWFGHTVAVDGNTIVVGADFEESGQTSITNEDGNASLDNSALYSGAVYVFKKDATGNWIQDAYLKPSNTRAGGHFGAAVAISGDTIVVGEANESSNQTGITNDDATASSDSSSGGSGAVYVFKKDSSGNWIQDAYLKASNADINDCFGRSVAISGNTIVVGAENESSSQKTITNDDGSASSDNSAVMSGAAYIFKKDSSGNWIQDAFLKASNSDIYCYFGFSVSISNDTVVVGAWGDSSNQTTVTNDDGAASGDVSADYAGSVYVYKKDSSGSWIQDAYLKASNAESGDQFGYSVAIYNNIIIVGACSENSSQKEISNTEGTASADNTASLSGAAYVFNKDMSGNWIQDAYLKASNAYTNDYFGCSVAISGEMIIVGAWGESSSQSAITNDDASASSDTSILTAGAAYIFKKDAFGNWIQDCYLKSSNIERNDQFGLSVSVSEGNVVIGANGEDSSQTEITNTDGVSSPNNNSGTSGAVYVFMYK